MAELTTWIAFFRGINVGGNNILRMKDLSAVLLKIGCAQVTTYIQSGNVAFKYAESNSEKLTKQIKFAVEKKQGFRPRVLLLSQKDLIKAASANPFPNALNEPKHLHLWFLETKPKNLDLTPLARLKTEKENFVLIGKVFYLHASGGVGNSKLAAQLEKVLGVAATARNWNTVTKMLELVKKLD